MTSTNIYQQLISLTLLNNYKMSGRTLKIMIFSAHIFYMINLCFVSAYHPQVQGTERRRDW